MIHKDLELDNFDSHEHFLVVNPKKLHKNKDNKRFAAVELCFKRMDQWREKKDKAGN